MFRRLATALSVALVAWVTSPSTAAAASIWDLSADWSDAANPNGPWAYRQGSTPLPALIGGGWGPGTQTGSSLPFWARTTADNAAGFLAGDIIVHSVDSQNGNPNLGEANVAWTSPISGVIDVSGEVFYSQFPLVRSNDFLLMLNSTLLAAGTVSATNGRGRSNPLAFAVTSLAVSQGDVLQLIFQRSPGQSDGSIAGVRLTITPEPALVSLLAAGLVGVLGSRSRRRAWPRARTEAPARVELAARSGRR